MIITTHMTDSERARLEQRLAAIEAEIADATQWGSHLTVLDEERRGIRLMLGSTERAPNRKGRVNGQRGQA